MTPTPDQGAPVRVKSRYVAHVWDLLCLTPSLESQRVYRLGAVRMGGLGEESVVEMESLGFTDVHHIRVPLLLLEAAVDSGSLRHVWREPRSESAEIVRRGTAARVAAESPFEPSEGPVSLPHGGSSPSEQSVPTAAPGAGDEAAVAALARLRFPPEDTPDGPGAEGHVINGDDNGEHGAGIIIDAIRAGRVPGFEQHDHTLDAKYKCAVDEVMSLRAQVAKLSGELRMEQGQHAITQEKRKEFEGYADWMCAERDRLSAEAERLKKAYHQRMDEIAAKQSHIAALTGERDAALVQAEKAAALAAGLREERNGLAEENIPLLNRAETAEQDRDKARADLAAMKADRDEVVELLREVPSVYGFDSLRRGIDAFLARVQP